MTPRFLIAEDAPDVAQVIAYSIRMAWPDGEVKTVSSGSDALKATAEESFDVAILDVTMPAPDGFEVCRRIRERGLAVGILMLTVRGAPLDKVRAFDSGADQYMTKPFEPIELQARLRALLRHPRAAEKEGGALFSNGELTVDFDACEVWLGGEIVAVTPTELRLLAELARHAGTTLSHHVLRDRVWGPEHYGDQSDLKVFVRRLRQKLGDDSEHPRYIETVRGFGYRMRRPA